MNTKIVIIGAGSGFGSRLSIDIMATPVLRDATICLCDIHPGRLETVRAYVSRMAEKHNVPVTIKASCDRTELLPDADVVITSVSVGGAAYAGQPYQAEIEIPRAYGIDQSVADTTSVGAVFRFLRTGPVQHQFFGTCNACAPAPMCSTTLTPCAC